MDLNGDGHLDILSGSYSGDGLSQMAGLFQVLWGEVGGGFSKAEPLKGTDGKELIIVPDKRGLSDEDTPRICTRPTAVDYDADGDLDLVVGNFEGTFYWFAGEGKGKFNPQSTRIDRGGKALKIASYHSDPFFVDWDGDGDLDMLSGDAEGGVSWSKNSAGKGKPISLEPFELLIKGGNKPDRWADDQAVPGDSSRVWVDDLNGDGKLDLVIGDHVIVKSPVDGNPREETSAREKAWEKEMNDLFKNLSENEASEELHGKIQAHFEKRGEFIKEEQTGFVWVYYQK